MRWVRSRNDQARPYTYSNYVGRYSEYGQWFLLIIAVIIWHCDNSPIGVGRTPFLAQPYLSERTQVAHSACRKVRLRRRRPVSGCSPSANGITP